MAFVLEDRVVETANNPGQGDFELLGAAENNQTFVAGIGNGNTTRYLAIGAEGAEIGVAQVQAGSPDRLLRPGTVKNFNGTTVPVNFSGTVTVACIASVHDVWATASGDYLPNGRRDLGSSSDRWRRGYFEDRVYCGGMTSQGSVVSGSGVYLGNENTMILGPGSGSQAGRMIRFLPRGTGSSSEEMRINDDGSVDIAGEIRTGGRSLLDRGSNANGEYVRFADGTQICTRTFLLDLTASVYTDIPWAAAFAANPAGAVALDGNRANNAILDGIASIALATQLSEQRWRVSVRETTPATVDIFLTAIGRWF